MTQGGQCHVSLRSGVTPGFIGHGELRGPLYASCKRSSQALFGRPRADLRSSENCHL